MKTEGCYITTTRNEKMEGNIPSTPSGEQKAKHADPHLCFQWHLTSWYHNFLHPSPEASREFWCSRSILCRNLRPLPHPLREENAFLLLPWLPNPLRTVPPCGNTRSAISPQAHPILSVKASMGWRCKPRHQRTATASSWFSEKRTPVFNENTLIREIVFILMQVKQKNKTFL